MVMEAMTMVDGELMATYVAVLMMVYVLLEKVSIKIIETQILIQAVTVTTVRRLAISQMHVPNCT